MVVRKIAIIILYLSYFESDSNLKKIVIASNGKEKEYYCECPDVKDFAGLKNHVIVAHFSYFYF